MLWSKLFIPTLRDDPAEAEVPSHKLLLRAGYVRQLAAGIYSYLFLAQRSLNKITAIVRQEMDAMGAQEFHLPALNPADLWQESGRWDGMGDNMFRLKDRFGRDLCLGMTHEEVMTALARGELRSYKQLPQIWYQIQTKFRDEQRPKSGLLRVRQFLMKDSYSFDLDAEGLEISFRRHYDVYLKIFARCGIRVIPVEAESGAMGGSQSTEFMVPSEAGEDLVVVCDQCRYAANLEKAVAYAVPPEAEDPGDDAAPEAFHTPGRKTIAEVAGFTGLPATSQMKSLVMVADGKPVLALLRGDHHLSETKFAGALGASAVRPAFAAEIVEWFGAEPGSLGPIGITSMRVIADTALAGRRNMIAGANRNDYHLRNVTPGRDFHPEYFDLRQVCHGDACAVCSSEVKLHKTIEAGHIFKLGYRYSEPMGLRVDGPAGVEVTPVMGSYGIGIERILCSAIEQRHDENGMCLPASIAPFTVVVTPVNNADATLRQAAERIYSECKARGIDVLYDDRDERPGVKFKDADLIGVPYRITIGSRKLALGVVELYDRRTKQTLEFPPDKAVDALGQML
jgi:prolyl-tRNA synthetase